MKIFRILFCSVFIFIIYFFFICSFLIPDKAESYIENRPLEQKPELSLETIKDGSFMNKYESYVNDQILFRDNFVTFTTNFKKYFLGQNEINNVIIGKDGYLIEKFVLSDLEDNRIDTNIEYINTFAKKYNVYFGLIPTSSEILTNKYTWYPNRLNQKDEITNIYNKLKNTTNIDMESTLLKHNDEYIYYKTDHHWTTLGAYYGYKELCDKMNLESYDLSEFDKVLIDDTFSGTIQSKINIDCDLDSLYKYVPKFETNYEMILNEDINTKTDSLYDESKLESKEKYAVYIGGNNAIVRIKNKNILDNSKLLIVKDSYSHSLIPFLANHYSELVIADMRYYRGRVEDIVKEDNINDVLILFNLKNFISDRYFVMLNSK